MTAPDYPTFNRRGFRMYQGQNGLAPSFTYRGGRYWIRTSDLCRVKAAL